MNKKIECYPKQLIKNIFNHVAHDTKLRKSIFFETMRPFMPYCLKKMNEDEFLPLNRDYKPIGLPIGFHYTYSDYKFLYINKNDLNLDVLWDNGIGMEGNQDYYLYSDSCTPCNDFLRYIDIVKTSIFLENKKSTFNDFWKFKLSYDKEGWERNLATKAGK